MHCSYSLFERSIVQRLFWIDVLLCNCCMRRDVITISGTQNISCFLVNSIEVCGAKNFYTHKLVEIFLMCRQKRAFYVGIKNQNIHLFMHSHMFICRILPVVTEKKIILINTMHAHVSSTNKHIKCVTNRIHQTTTLENKL